MLYSTEGRIVHIASDRNQMSELFNASHITTICEIVMNILPETSLHNFGFKCLHTPLKASVQMMQKNGNGKWKNTNSQMLFFGQRLYVGNRML